MPPAARRLVGTRVVLLVAAFVGLIAVPAGAQTATPTPTPTGSPPASPSPSPTATPGPAAPPARAIKPALSCQSDASTRSDFNADGTSDVAIAAPFDDLFNNGDVGSLNVVVGLEGETQPGSGGTSTSGDVLLSPAAPGIPAFKWIFGPGYLFGKGLAAGDFNADGRADLAVGSPGMAVNGLVNSGAVLIFYGDATEVITTKFSQVFHQDRGAMPGLQEKGDSFGWTLAAGDFNGDDVDDLAIGAPGEDIGRVADAGQVTVVYGTSGARSEGGGLTSSTGALEPQLFVQGTNGLIGLAEKADMFGLALAAGNFNGDSLAGPIDELAIGVPHEDWGTRTDAGAVHVIDGSSGGLTGSNQLWVQDKPGVEGSSEAGDLYGCALAAGNFNGDTVGAAPNIVDMEDLAIGVPGEDVGFKDQGGVNVIYALPDGGGLSADFGPGVSQDDEGDQYFLERPGLGGTTETAAANERFGQSVNAQNINPIVSRTPTVVTDPAWELAIGAPGEEGTGGEVFFIGGVRNDGLRDLATTFYTMHQNVSGTHRGGEVGDEFGQGLAFGDYGGDGDVDIVIMGPGDSSCGENHEAAEFLSLGPSFAGASGDAIPRAGAGLTLYGNGMRIGANNGPAPAFVGAGNNSLTRCDMPDGDLYGLEGDPQEGAEFGHTVAGL